MSFPSFQLATRLNSQNTIESEFLIKSDTLISLWILVFPIGIIEVLTSRKYCFWIYFSSLHDYWTPSTWNSLVHTSWGKMERCEKRVFSSSKCEKKKMLKHKYQVRKSLFIDSHIFEYEGLYLSLPPHIRRI